MRTLTTSSIALVIGLLIAAPAAAQVSPADEDGRILTSATMDAALTGHESIADQQRAELSQLLATPQVQALAVDRGIDMDRVESAASSLSDDEVEALAPLMEKATAMAQNMGSVTISVAAIIIILLVLILIS
ncbi:MAG: hypothetical protein EA351_06115 [Gemmatimonadales bacterium]|nr:MAG: hypothetical protein EA351_06115 [Gemmatimonadales bacterium]